jgi:hypothetical protein
MAGIFLHVLISMQKAWATIYLSKQRFGSPPFFSLKSGLRDQRALYMQPALFETNFEGDDDNEIVLLCT